MATRANTQSPFCRSAPRMLPPWEGQQLTSSSRYSAAWCATEVDWRPPCWRRLNVNTNFPRSSSRWSSMFDDKQLWPRRSGTNMKLHSRWLIRISGWTYLLCFLNTLFLHSSRYGVANQRGGRKTEESQHDDLCEGGTHVAAGDILLWALVTRELRKSVYCWLFEVPRRRLAWWLSTNIIFLTWHYSWAVDCQHTRSKASIRVRRDFEVGFAGVSEKFEHEIWRLPPPATI